MVFDSWWIPSPLFFEKKYTHPKWSQRCWNSVNHGFWGVFIGGEGIVWYGPVWAYTSCFSLGIITMRRKQITLFEWSPPSQIILTYFLTYHLEYIIYWIYTYILTFFLDLASIYSDILSAILSDILFWHSIWHLFWHSLWHGHCRTWTASARSQWAAIWRSAHWDPELAVEIQGCRGRRRRKQLW